MEFLGTLTKVKPDSIEPYQPSTEELDYYIQRRSGRKRDYVYSYGESRTCPHSHLIEIVIGSGDYRCADCNYVFTIVSAKQKPLHHAAIQGIQTALYFAKEHGLDALQEVMRTPLGQYGGRAQKSVLPEGMTFEEAAKALEAINVNEEDGGSSALKELRDNLWVSKKSRVRRLKELEGVDDHRLPPKLRDYRDKQQKVLNGSSQDQRELGESVGVEGNSRGDAMPGLQEGAVKDTEDRNI